MGQGDNTVNLFDKAKQLVRENPNGYKHVWIIYDTDDFPKDKIDVVPVLCENESNSDCKYHAIWSNQCIELWFLLHFSFMYSDLHRDEYKSKLSENLNAIGAVDYSKNREDIFLVVKNYQNFAIENAKRLDKINLETVNGFTYEISEAMRCINSGKTESPVVPWEVTIACSQLFDKIIETQKQ